MENLELGLEDGSSSSEANPEESRQLNIQRCLQSLAHTCQCCDASCCLPNCEKMKQVITHTKLCQRKTNGGCPICKQLIALCCYHAKHCQETKCPVPFCLNIKHKLKQQQLQQKLQQAQLLRHMVTQPEYECAGAEQNVQMSGEGAGSVESAVSGAVSSANSMNVGPPNASMELTSSHQPQVNRDQVESGKNIPSPSVQETERATEQWQQCHDGVTLQEIRAGQPLQVVLPGGSQMTQPSSPMQAAAAAGCITPSANASTPGATESLPLQEMK